MQSNDGTRQLLQTGLWTLAVGVVASVAANGAGAACGSTGAAELACTSAAGVFVGAFDVGVGAGVGTG